MGDNLKRVFIHIPVGLLCAFMTTREISGIVASIIFAWFFKIYELNEDRYCSDQAWKDIAGFLWGIGLFYTLYSIWETWLKTMLTS
jgi:hypothetical protein